jgi:hypothetical protein
MASICHNLITWNTGENTAIQKHITSNNFAPSAHLKPRKLATAVSKLADCAQSDSIDAVHIGNKFWMRNKARGKQRSKTKHMIFC